MILLLRTSESVQGCAILVAVLWLLAGTACQKPRAGATGVPVVYTTFPVIEYVTRTIAGPAVEVRRLIEPGDSPHSYEPTPSDARAAGAAELILFAAGNLDRWATRISDAEAVELIGLLPDSLKLYPSDGLLEPDPHFWLDPISLRAAVEALPPVLCRSLPAQCETFQTNAESLAGDLTRLDGEIRARLSGVGSITLVLSTPFFSYFARRYDLDVAGTLGRSEALDLGPRRIATLARSLQATSTLVDVVVCEANESQVAARMIAEMLGARVAKIDPVGGAPGRDTYRDMMLFNVQQILGEAT